MSAPPGINEGQSTTRPPLFNEKYYSWWKARMEDFLTVEDYELWTIDDRKEHKGQEILICGFGPDEYNRISVYSNAKEIWDALQTAHEGTNQVRRSMIELFTINYELFSMKQSEPIQEMMTRFTIITNELKPLGKVFTSKELVNKILRILPASWESKVIAIQKAKELDKISLDELIGNLKTHYMRKLELRKEEPKRDKALVLKVSEEDESDNDELDLAMFTKFKKFMKTSKNASKRENCGKPKQIDKSSYDGCYKCNKLDHIFKD
ncbi:uncharacterized protein [Nicotiana tomentosiformis]|uniref:uncharacterized protein n=1 Tax=Nicotiana tomentosiformis TaxID=4098 RepID=UPI00388C55DD